MRKSTSLSSLVPLLLASAISCAKAATTLTPSSLARVSFNGPNTYLDTGSGAQLPIGDGATNGRVFSAVFNFTLTSYTEEISSSTQILFTITPSNITDNAPNIRLVALTMDGDTVSASDATAEGDIIATFPASAFTVGTPFSFDVTSYVKADALAGGPPIYTSFRLESDFTANNSNGVGDIVTFGTIGNTDARLEIIPEPGSSALLVGAASMAFFSRRRKLP